MSKSSSEKKHWDAYWESSKDIGEVYANDDRILSNLIPVLNPAGKRVLEVGAGSGRDSAAMANVGAEVWTLDYSEQSLFIMNDRLDAPLTIVCGDALALPLESESFDVVFHQGLLEHFSDPVSLLAENHRVLKPGGYVLIDVPQRFHYYTLAKHVLMFFDRWFAGWETEFSPGELSALVQRAGFEPVAMYGHNLYPPIWYRGIRRVLRARGIRLPMHPMSGSVARKIRDAATGGLPRTLRLHTSMVIGCIARKADPR